MKYLIKQFNNITGRLSINVGKNFLLNTIPGLLLLHGEIEITNYIEYPDVVGLLEILSFLGVDHRLENRSIIIDTRNYCGKPITHPKAVIRSCFMIAGAMLTRNKKAYIPISYGWCTDMQSQKRACNFHLECFTNMGAHIDIWSKDNGDELVDIDGSNMKGCSYTFPKVSVTGTVNTVLAGLGCEGLTILNNVALEPEVIFAIDLFRSWGYNIIFNTNQRQIIVHGTNNFQPLILRERLILNLPADRLLAGSFMMLPLMNSGYLHLSGIDIVKNNLQLIKTLQNIGANIIIIDDNNLEVTKKSSDELKYLDIEANPFPGIATDLFPFLVVLAIFCKGKSRLIDNVYNTRVLSLSLFLQKFNVDIEIITGCNVSVNQTEKIKNIHNNEYENWLNGIQNIRGQTAAFFFMLMTQKNFIIDFNSFGNQIVRGYPSEYLMEDLKTIGLDFEKLN